jgi:PleD family two-component response regulator
MQQIDDDRFQISLLTFAVQKNNYKTTKRHQQPQAHSYRNQNFADCFVLCLGKHALSIISELLLLLDE